jgi:GWxTD domain-containing protein
MGLQAFRAIGLTFAAVFLLVVSAGAQSKTSPSPTPHELERARHAELKARFAQLPPYYRAWLNEDVVYIISPDERGTFLLMKNDEERNQFIAGFWARRNPDPTAPSNSFVKEHYRRLIYANENFGGSIEGWKSDRGRLYVMWGPPDSIDTFVRGLDCEDREKHTVVHDAPARTSWSYRYLEGVGENVRIDFLQPRSEDGRSSQVSSYEYSQSPCQFEPIPVEGSSPALFGLAPRELDLSKIDARGYLRDSIDEIPRRKVDPKLDAALKAKLSGPQIPIRVRFDAVRVTSVTSLATIRVSIPTSAMTFPVTKDQPARATVLIRAKNSVTGATAFEFSSIVPLSRAELPNSNWTNLYDDQTPLALGQYELQIAVRDEETGIIPTQFLTVSVPTSASETP